MLTPIEDGKKARRAAVGSGGTASSVPFASPAPSSSSVLASSLRCDSSADQLLTHLHGCHGSPYITIAAVDPVKGTTCDVMISCDRMQAVGRRSVGHAKECAYIVPAILQHPAAIFEGLRWDEDEDHRGVGWRCYCGIPGHAYLRDGTAIRPYPGQVYLVFVNDEQVAYNWRWEEADPDNPRCPMNFQERFRRQLL